MSATIIGNEDGTIRIRREVVIHLRSRCPEQVSCLHSSWPFSVCVYTHAWRNCMDIREICRKQFWINFNEILQLQSASNRLCKWTYCRRCSFYGGRLMHQYWVDQWCDMTLWCPANKWYSVWWPFGVWRLDVDKYCIWHILWHLVKYGGHYGDRPTMAPYIDMSPIMDTKELRWSPYSIVDYVYVSMWPWFMIYNNIYGFLDTDGSDPSPSVHLQWKISSATTL